MYCHLFPPPPKLKITIYLLNPVNLIFVCDIIWILYLIIKSHKKLCFK